MFLIDKTNDTYRTNKVKKKAQKKPPISRRLVNVLSIFK